MSKIRRRYIEKYLYGINKEVLSSDKIIYVDDYSQHYLDPNGTSRNVSFSGTFTKGDTYKIKNIASDNSILTVTSITPNITIYPDEIIEFFYDGTNWNVSNFGGLLELDEDGNLMPIA